MWLDLQKPVLLPITGSSIFFGTKIHRYIIKFHHQYEAALSGLVLLAASPLAIHTSNLGS